MPGPPGRPGRAKSSRQASGPVPRTRSHGSERLSPLGLIQLLSGQVGAPEAELPNAGRVWQAAGVPWSPRDFAEEVHVHEGAAADYVAPGDESARDDLENALRAVVSAEQTALEVLKGLARRPDGLSKERVGFATDYMVWVEERARKLREAFDYLETVI